MAAQTSKTRNSTLDQLCINTIRFLAADAVEHAGSGHPGMPMGMAPVAYVLWDRVLKFNPANPSWPDRDRFILSNGHGSMLLYSLLHLTGYDVSMDDLKGYRQWGSITPGHPEWRLTPGVETTTGPLGQGFSNGVGMAIAERMLAHRYNRPGYDLVNHYTYAACSDGDLEEGVASEAASLAGALGLGKLIYLYDDNGISIDGDVSVTFKEDVGARFRAYGWHVAGPIDGLDLEAIESSIREGQQETERPTLILVRTTIGYGAPTMAGTAGAHGKALGADEVQGAREALGWTYGPFEVPDEVRSHMQVALDRGAEAQGKWDSLREAYRREHPEQAAAFERDLAGGLPDGWGEALDAVHGELQKPMATRVASSQAINAASKAVYAMTGGSADLASSNNSAMDERGLFQSDNPGGANIAFGIREHGMGSVANGIAVHGGFIPYTATFLIFSDYMRAPMRLAALSGYPTIFLFTHDSVALGGDGPTHQPISQLMSLRLIPNLNVIRPADPHETVEAWRMALARRDGPTALVLTRQGVPLLDAGVTTGLAKGAYILRDSGKRPDILLIATGSEVHPTLEAAKLLESEGTATRVVSMPSWELFEAQPASYREEVLPTKVRRRLAVEAGAGIGWGKYVGLEGDVVCMEGFGMSAPGDEAYTKFGFSAENIASKARKLTKGE